MRTKFIGLVFLCLLLLSFHGFSQTTEKSDHPLLDKYYPQLKNTGNNTDTSKAITTQITPLPGAKPVAPVKPVPAMVSTPVAATVPPETTTPGVTTTPAMTTTPSMTPAAMIAAPVPVATTAPAITATPALPTTTVSGVTTSPAVTSVPAMPATNTISKPTAVTIQAPVQKPQGQPAPSLYSETRLGSSTRQYDTWEKNNNGAGSVTTSPK